MAMLIEARRCAIWALGSSAAWVPLAVLALLTG
jgi:hypothetical protein